MPAGVTGVDELVGDPGAPVAEHPLERRVALRIAEQERAPARMEEPLSSSADES